MENLELAFWGHGISIFMMALNTTPIKLYIIPLHYPVYNTYRHVVSYELQISSFTQGILMYEPKVKICKIFLCML